MAKIALLIGVSEYEPGLDGLPSAVNDAIALRQVLTNPEMGEFADADVRVLQNPDRQTMADEIYRLFAGRQRDDLVLLYFSGHGVDDGSEFYFTNRYARMEQGKLVPSTALEAQSVQRWMQQSPSQRKVIILDSCFSSAFAKGVKVKDGGSVNPEQFLGGKGTAILTASTRYAETRENLDLSVYTHYLVEGIRTGGADRDDDGWIGMEELHEYASSKVKEAAPAMTPEFYRVRDGSKILLAKSPKDDPKLRYRKEVKLLAEEDEGEFSFINRHYLDDLRQKRGLSPEDAAQIEAEELEPYRLRQVKVDRYRTVFAGAIAHRYPLTDRDRLGLQRLQQLLSLRDEDVMAIESPLLVLKQAEYEQRQAQLEQEQQRSLREVAARHATERLAAEQRRQREIAEQREREQTEQRRLLAAEQGRQQEIAEQREREQAQRRQTASTGSSSPAARPLAGIQTQQFEFETASVTLKKGGLFGGKTTVEISRGRSRAQFFVENLGNGATLEMVAISGGTFQMGSNEYKDEKPIHAVIVPPFFMGKYPVTQAQYEAVMGKNPAEFKGAKRPVENVSWEDAIAFCTQLSQKTGKHYRLPSEAEWEYACRAGTTTPFYFGETITTDLANYRGTDWEYEGTTYPGNYGAGPKGIFREQTTDVGSFAANAFGLFDMHGNVWEWCADRWHENYQGAPIDGSAWETGGDAARRTVRGGSWIPYPVLCCSANRSHNAPDYLNRYLGFRVVCPSA